MKPLDPWQLTKSAIILVLTGFFIGCTVGACKVGLALMQRLAQ